VSGVAIEQFKRLAVEIWDLNAWNHGLASFVERVLGEEVRDGIPVGRRGRLARRSMRSTARSRARCGAAGAGGQLNGLSAARTSRVQESATDLLADVDAAAVVAGLRAVDHAEVDQKLLLLEVDRHAADFPLHFRHAETDLLYRRVQDLLLIGVR